MLYLAIFLDTLNNTYLCNPNPSPGHQEAIDVMDDPEQKRYTLIQVIEIN